MAITGRGGLYCAHCDSDIAQCSVVLAELYFGAARSGPGREAANRALIESLRKRFSSLPFDDIAAEEHGRLRAELAARGTPIGPHDAMIAAIALAHRATLVTHNTTEFSRVHGRVLEDWQSP